MIHKDFLEELIENFCTAVERSLLQAHETNNPSDLAESEAAVARLLELDPKYALTLAPDSLVLMLQLNGVGYSIAQYAAYTLDRVGDIYDRAQEDQKAQLRHAQAQGIAKGFGFDVNECPEELKQVHIKFFG